MPERVTSIHYHPEFPSQILRHRRALAVYLPPGYGQEPDRRYPVFYLHDGQNLFDPATAFGGVAWQADQTAERLMRAGEVEPAILVGIANTPDRLREYGPTGRRAGPNSPARRYARFLVEEVKPFIDQTYATRPERVATAVGGSSMGGLISLFLCRWYPETFGMCAAMSPSLWWDRDLFLRAIQADTSWLRRLRVWLDTGDREGNTTQGQRDHLRRVRRFARALAALGLRPGRDYYYLEVPGGEHNEAAWGARFGQVLGFFFGVTAAQAEARPV